MARFARVVAPGIAHHVTQRGNDRRYILRGDAERAVYLDLLYQGMRRHAVELAAYCLMSNHVHLVVVPGKKDGLARCLRDAHGRFAAYWNAANGASGHVWQGRFYSCPLDEGHLWEAMRYVELNPVRASLVGRASDWPWSSATAHCGVVAANSWLAMGAWSLRWSAESWRGFLDVAQEESSLVALRDSTYSGRPLGSRDFTQALEKEVHRLLTPQKPGPKGRPEPTAMQASLSI